MSSETSTAPLRRDLLLAFTLPTLVLGFTHGPEGQIQAIYAKHAGLALTAIAAAMLLSKVFDALTYPLIGYLSDRSFARRGTRKGWIVAGTLVSMLGMWFLLRPPAGVTVVYFGIWMSVTYAGWKLMEIPLQAWSYGLTGDYSQRARTQAWRTLATLLGQLLFVATPYIAVQLQLSDSTELDFRSLGVAGVICVVALPLATLVAVMRVPEGAAAAPPPGAMRRHRLADIAAVVWSSRPLRRLLAAFLPLTLLSGMAVGVSYLFIDAYLGLGKQFPAIMGLGLLTTLAGVPFWAALGARHERHRVWAVSLVIGGMACTGCMFMTPGPGAMGLSFVLMPVIYFCLSSVVLVFTMCGDIVDHGRLATGEDFSGLYSSTLIFLNKSLGSLSAAAGLALAGAFGFEPAATVQTASGALGIKLAAAGIPAVGLFVAAAVIWTYPLTRQRLAAIHAELALRGDSHQPPHHGPGVVPTSSLHASP